MQTEWQVSLNVDNIGRHVNEKLREPTENIVKPNVIKSPMASHITVELAANFRI